MTRLPIFFAFSLVSALATGPALANPFFNTNHQGALSRSFLLPPVGDAGVELVGDWQWQAQYDLTNDYHTATEGDESITLDGESQRLLYTFRQGLDDGWEWSLAVPIYHQGGGFMDGFIEDWHEWFGLPNGGRELAPQDRYLYEVTRGGNVIYRNTEKGNALGDIVAAAGWQWREGIVLRGALKLPTGDDRKLSGENMGAALWTDMALPFAADSSWRGFVSIGASGAERAELLPELQQTAVAIGGLGLSYGWSENLRFTVQLYGHSALYKDTELEALKRPGLQVTFGGSYQILPNALLHLAVQEDAVVSSSPDFSVHAALTIRPPSP